MNLRILAIHNRYLISGGEDKSHVAEINMLKSNGMLVDEYTEDNHRISELNYFSLALKTIWSQETYRKIRQILSRTKYDLVIIQNTFPLISPSIYYAIKKHKIPCIQYLRNYRLMCLNALLFRNNMICEDCMRKFIPWPGILHACYRNQFAASKVVAAMLTIHRLLGTWQTKIDRYIALTEFARMKFIEGGIPKDLVAVKPNFVNPDPEPGEGEGNYFLFVGRLSNEKGVRTLIDTWDNLTPSIELRIIGNGDLKPEVVEKTLTNPSIKFLGEKSSNEVLTQIGNARCVIIPSECYENLPRVMVESFSKGTPVIASNLKSISGIVKDGITGLLFETGNASDLAAKVKWCWQNPDKLSAMRHNARREFEEKYTIERNFRLFMEIYNGIKA